MAAPAGNKHSSKYNKKRHEKIVEEILKGNSKRVAFTLSGMHPDTVWDWLRAGRENPERYPEYVALAEDIAHAEAMVESEKVGIVKAAADAGTWQAAAWWLERRRPADWGKTAIEAPAAEKEPRTQVNVLILEDPNAREASRELLRRLGGLGAGSPALPVGTRALREPAEDS